MNILLHIMALVLSGCTQDPSSVFNAAGPHAALTGKLFWSFMAVNTMIWVLVLGVLFFFLWRRRESGLVIPIILDAGRERRLQFVVGASIVMTVIILTGYVVASYSTDKHLTDLDRSADLIIEVTAHQWWWDIRYPSATPSEVFTTANEIHVPVGETVRLNLTSSDVIHSVWFPNLAGKRDVIPGREQDLVIRADKAGRWQGRCAEFCGVQHAFMMLTLIAEPKDVFESWRTAQRLSAGDPVMADAKYGRDVFSKGACATCHVVRGKDSTGSSSNAPDLTHLMSRSTIAAGARPNTPENLRVWVQDPHSIKPGVHMPTILQKPDDMQHLMTYLETLK
jgi:cytochrome c oxidase subunit 2